MKVLNKVIEKMVSKKKEFIKNEQIVLKKIDDKDEMFAELTDGHGLEGEFSNNLSDLIDGNYFDLDIDELESDDEGNCQSILNLKILLKEM